MSAADVSTPALDTQSEQAPQADQNIATGPQPQPTTQGPQAADLVQSDASSGNAQRPTFDSQEPSFWKRILVGALGGLSGGVPGAGAGAIGAAIETPAQYSAAKLNAASVQTNTLKMRDLASATAAANFTNLNTQYHNQDQAAQDQHQDHVDEWAKFNRDNFGIPYDVVPNNHGGQAVLDYMAQSQAQDPTGQGAHVPQGTLVGPHQIFVPKQDSGTADQHFKLLQDLSMVTNSPSPTREQFDRMSPAQQDAASSGVLRIAMGRDQDGKLVTADNIPDQISTLTSGLKTYQQQPDAAQNPALVSRIQGTIANLSDQLSAHNKNKADSAAQVSAAEAPGKIAVSTAEAQAKDTISRARKDDDVIVATDPATNKSQVMTRKDAEDNNFFVGSKADTLALQGISATADDVQGTVNRLAQFVNSPAMAKVDPRQVATALGPDTMSVGAFGSHLSLAGVNAKLKNMSAADMNDSSRQYSVLVAQAHEAATQVPRLQTLGKVNRNSQQQMDAAVAMLPTPSDTQPLAQQKMNAFQDLIDPIITRIPSTPGVTIRPSWRSQQK